MTGPQVGEDFAGYHIEAEIGRGGMSVVYRATEQSLLGRTVALKVMAPFLTHDDSFRQRFLHEARTAAGLRHPGIIPIYAFDVQDDVLYLTMQLVDGTDLHRRLGDQGPLSLGEAVHIIGQAGDALDAVHSHGVTHRDIKPANILLDHTLSSSGPHVYIVDFGLARAADGRRFTGTGQVLGTLSYAAPEQLRGETVDARTDIYALGCVLFESLTGRRPFDQGSDVALMYAHLEAERPEASALRPELGPGVDAVIRRAMAKNPDERWRTCRDMMDAFVAATDQATVIRTRPVPPPVQAPDPTDAPDPRSSPVPTALPVPGQSPDPTSDPGSIPPLDPTAPPFPTPVDPVSTRLRQGPASVPPVDPGAAGPSGAGAPPGTSPVLAGQVPRSNPGSPVSPSPVDPFVSPPYGVAPGYADPGSPTRVSGGTTRRQVLGLVGLVGVLVVLALLLGLAVVLTGRSSTTTAAAPPAGGTGATAPSTTAAVTSTAASAPISTPSPPTTAQAPITTAGIPTITTVPTTPPTTAAVTTTTGFSVSRSPVGSWKVVDTAPIHAGTTTASALLGSIATGASVPVVCTTPGEFVDPGKYVGTSDWNLVQYNGIQGYVPDYYMNTGVGAQSAINNGTIPRC